MGPDVAIQSPPTTIPYADVVRRHAPYVFNVARGILREPSLAEDASQEAFVALLRHTGAFPNEAALRGWLGRVACNAALKVLRSKTRRRRRELAVGVGSRGEARGMDETAVPEHLALRRLVDDLPPELRLPVRMKYFQGTPQTEIATVLSCSTGTVSNRLRDALDRLRLALARAGLAGVLPTLETRLDSLVPDPVPSALVSRLLALETAASLTTVGGGMTVLTKLILSGVALLAATIGATFVWPGWGAGSARENEAPAEMARMDDDPPAPPRLEGRGEAADEGGSEARERVREEAPGNAPAGRPVEGAGAAAPTVTLRGVVFEPDGRPAPDARVVLATPIKARPSLRFEMRTAADGTWERAGLPANCAWVISVRLAGTASWRTRLDPVREPTPALVETRLHASWSVRGRLFDERGEPVTGDVPLIVKSGSSIGGSNLRVDDEGRFEIRDFDPVKYEPEVTRIVFRHPAYLPQGFGDWVDRIGSDGWAHIDVRLEEGCGIAGKVLGPDGVPYSGVRLRVLPAGEKPGFHSWEQRLGESDAEGRYAIRGLPDGDYVLRANTRGLVLEEPFRFTVAHGDRLAHDLSLGVGRLITGRIVDVNGRPVAGAEVEHHALDDGYAYGTAGVTDEDGHFRFTGLPLERRRFDLWLSYLPLATNAPLQVERIEATSRALTIVIRSPLPRPEPEPASEGEGLNDDGEVPTPSQVGIPSESITVEFPAGR